MTLIQLIMFIYKKVDEWIKKKHQAPKEGSPPSRQIPHPSRPRRESPGLFAGFGFDLGTAVSSTVGTFSLFHPWLPSGKLTVCY